MLPPSTLFGVLRANPPSSMYPAGPPCNGMLPMHPFYAAAHGNASGAFSLPGTKTSSHSSGRSHSYCPEPPGAAGSLLLKWGWYFNRFFERGLIVALSHALPSKKGKKKEKPVPLSRYRAGAGAQVLSSGAACSRQ